MINLFSPRQRTWAVFFVVLFFCCIQAQTKTNLEVFKSLVDSSLTNIIRMNPNISENISLTISSSPHYQVFQNQIYQSIKSLNKNIFMNGEEVNSSSLIYLIEDAKVGYGEVFRDGLFGYHLVERKIMLKGSFTIKNNGILSDNFYYEKVDTILFDEINLIENPAYPFTQGNIPAEPFLSNIFEPIIALTTAAIVITLFFTVRSK